MEYLQLDVDSISHVVSIPVSPIFLLGGISGLFKSDFSNALNVVVGYPPNETFNLPVFS